MAFLSSCSCGSAGARGAHKQQQKLQQRQRRQQLQQQKLQQHQPLQPQLQQYQSSPNFSGGKFTYPVPTPVDYSPKALLSILKAMLKPNPGIRPRTPLPVQAVNAAQLQADHTASQIFWLGHSTLLVRLSGKTLLIDPVFSPYSSPFRFGGKRYSDSLPITMEQLPYIDTVLISHDHYDHLDRHSIRQLKDKVGRFHVPLGVGQHLERWGVPPQRIAELDWWEEAEWAGIQLACTPARHNSGRGLRGQNTTLWCSWRIADGQINLFYSGDSGYGPHFAEIGQTYGPFDIAMIESGQYDEHGWWPYHMLPEQTVQASQDVRARQLLPVHWGAFTLSRHTWAEPIERVLQAAERSGVAVVTPQLGEPVGLGLGVDHPASGPIPGATDKGLDVGTGHAALPQARWWRAFV